MSEKRIMTADGVVLNEELLEQLGMPKVELYLNEKTFGKMVYGGSALVEETVLNEQTKRREKTGVITGRRVYCTSEKMPRGFEIIVPAEIATEDIPFLAEIKLVNPMSRPYASSEVDSTFGTIHFRYTADNVVLANAPKQQQPQPKQ
jgi:Bacterial protein of unknown function (DUF961).